MPPKKEEKKEIVRAFQPSKFWKYWHSSQEALDKTAAFLTNFQKELIQLINQEKSLEENFELLCDKIGIAVHPSLHHIPKQESKFPQLHNNDYGERLLSLMNFKIDSISFKVLTFLVAQIKLSSLKLSRNQFDNQSEDLKKFLEKQNSSSLLFLQWNPLINSPHRSDIFLSTVRPNIQHLILRQNCLGNELVKELIKKIKSFPEITLKSLDLTANQITTDITQQICNFVEEEKNIEFLGLSKNSLNKKSFLNKIFSCIGQIPLSEEEYVKHQEAVKARDEVVERNKKKKKGAADEPVPFVFELKQTENGRFYIKNTSLQSLNLANIGYGDETLNIFKKFAENQGAKVQVFLDRNKFSKKSKDIFKVYGNLLI